MADNRATYAQDKDRITVLNECRLADGGFDSARGIAHAVEATRRTLRRSTPPAASPAGSSSASTTAATCLLGATLWFGPTSSSCCPI
ncbi:MAG: hypothetical protein IPI44_13845 [Sulfuritalea sp.]|nr:hypothetical protein [Sulfuritalea sp.]